MKVLSYKNLVMRFFFCATGSWLYVMSRGMTFFICELPRLNTPYSYCVSTSPQRYRQYFHPQRYFYAVYLTHHLHLHSELVHSLFYIVHDVFSFRWNGVLQYHHSYRLVWHLYSKSLALMCRIPPALQVWCHSVYRDTQVCLSAVQMEY